MENIDQETAQKNNNNQMLMVKLPQSAVPEKLGANSLQTELVKYLMGRLQMLDELDQIILSLYYEQDLNIEEISAVMGMSKCEVAYLYENVMQHIANEFKFDVDLDLK